MEDETIGGILVSWRKKQGKFITDCANELNAPIEYLDAIENNSFLEMPNDQYTYKLINKYAEYIGIKGKDSLKIKSLLKEKLKISERSLERGKYLRRGSSLLSNIIFAIMVIICAMIFLDEEFYGKQLLKDIDTFSLTKIDLRQSDQTSVYNENEILNLDMNIDIDMEENQFLQEGLNTMQIQALGNAWVEVRGNNDTKYISRNFISGERYLFYPKGNEILLTDNLSNILIMYNDTLINTKQIQANGIVEIDLDHILF